MSKYYGEHTKELANASETPKELPSPSPSIALLKATPSRRILHGRCALVDGFIKMRVPLA